MTDWNPNIACAVGLQWFPYRERQVLLDARNQLVGALLESTVTEQVDQVRIGTLNALGDPPGLFSGYQLEIFNVTGLPTPQPTTTTTFVPSADIQNQGMYGWDAATSPSISPPTQSNLFQFVADSASTPATFPNGVTVHDESLIFPIFGAVASLAFNLGGVVGALPSRQVVALRLDVTAAAYTLAGTVASGAVRPFLQIDGQRYFAATMQARSDQPTSQTQTAVWPVNPSTGCAWTITELEAFDDTVGTSMVGVVINPTGSSNILTTVERIAARVVYQTAVDNRVAVGCIASDVDEVNVGWTTILLAEPDGTPGWPKLTGEDYLFVLRRRWGQGQMTVRLLSADRLPPVPWTPAVVELFASSPFVTDDRVYDFEAATNPAVGTLPILLEVSGVTSQDSQGYMSINGDGHGGLIASRQWTKVDATQDLQQEITPGVTDSYAFMRVLVRQQNPLVDADLVLQVRRRSDDVAIGSPVVITTTDLESPRSGDAAWQTIGMEIDTPAALVATTQYYVDMTSAAPAGRGWEVQVASALPLDWPQGPPPADVGDVLFGGDQTPPDRLTVDGTEYSTMSACVTVHTQGEPPDNFTATAVDDGGCLGHVALSWDAPADLEDCGGFLRWELERGDTRTPFEVIATGDDATATTFDDYEMRRGLETTYRIRVIRDDEAPGEWATDTATVALDCCGYVFASNADPALTVWADDPTDGRRPYDFVENVATQQFIGRKFQVEEHEIEYRGVRFTTPLLLAAEGGVGGTDPATVPGIETFMAVLRSFRPGLGAALPYTSVTTQDGDRWFASIRSPDGERREPQGAYTLVVTVTETTDRPEPQPTQPTPS